MNITQVVSLSPFQLAAFSSSQIASLSAPEIAGFNLLQLAAIGIYPSDTSVTAQTTNYEAAIPVLTDVARVTDANANVAPINSTLNQLTNQPLGDIASISSVSKFANASDGSGVLPIAILNSSNQLPKAVGIAFEQDEETVSLRLVSAPKEASLNLISNKSVFKDKLMPFFVQASTGEMIEFQGGLVNKRMIIVAPSASAKSMIQTDMVEVVAAAIASIGVEGRVMLAKLDGLVLDLR
jgi:hypothetical protein